MIRSNVQMLSPTFPQNYDSGKVLIQTFGRGQLNKYVEPNQSQRNQYEQKKIEQSKRLSTKKAQSEKKIIKMSNIKKNTQNKENDMRQFKAHSTTLKKDDQFEQIDEISHKINSIIKSISSSCNKRQTGSVSKTYRLERTQTTSALNKIHNKYSNTQVDSKQKVIQQFKQERLKLPLQNKEDNQNQPKWFDESCTRYRTKSKFESKGWNAEPSSNTDRHHYGAGVVKNEEPEFDDINERIQMINDKITKYEEKMSNYQEVYKVNKERNQKYLKTNQSRQIRQGKDETKNKNSFNNQLKKSLLSKNIDVDLNPKKNKQSVKEYSSFQKQKSSIQFQKKSNYYTEKYKELMQEEKRRNHQSKQVKTETKKHQQSIGKTPKTHKKLGQSNKRMNTKQSEIHYVEKNDFIKTITRQIALDQDFRYAKHMFAGMQELFGGTSFSGRQKWVKLKNQLNSEGLTFTLQEITQIFMPRDDEIDPFMSVSHSHEELIHSVVFAYQAAEKHWNDNLYHGWTFWQLKEANFLAEKLDRGKKGYITLQDLAFYLNTQYDGQFRNRDLMLIFHRLGSKEKDQKGIYKLKFKEIMSKLISQ